MSYGVYRRLFRVRPRPHAVATLTSAAPAVTTSLPLARRRIAESVYRRPSVTILRRRSIVGLPNADPLVSLPLVRRRPPYSVYLRPPPPIVRLRRMVIGLPNANPIVSLPMVRRRPPYSVYLLPPPPIVRLRRMVIGLPNADAAVPAPAAPATKGRRPIRLEIAASKVDLLKLPRPPVKLPPSIVVPAIAEMRFEALTPMVLAGPVELLLKLASINIILARPAVEPGAVTLALPVVPLTRPLTYLLDAWSRMDRAEILAIVQGVVEDVALLGFSDRPPE